MKRYNQLNWRSILNESSLGGGENSSRSLAPRISGWREKNENPPNNKNPQNFQIWSKNNHKANKLLKRSDKELKEKMGLGRLDKKYLTIWTFICVASMLLYSEYVLIKRKNLERLEDATTDAFVFYNDKPDPIKKENVSKYCILTQKIFK